MTADLQTIDGRPALRLERYLDHPVERVWRAVSEPAEVRRWMPAAADWTLTLGAEFELGGQQGQITELDPPHLIGWTFGADRFRFTLRAEGRRLRARVHPHLQRRGPGRPDRRRLGVLPRSARRAAGRPGPVGRARPPASRGAARALRRPLRARPRPRPGVHRDPGLSRAQPPDGPTLRLERRYDQPVERVWRALTEPDELRRWFPGELEVSHSDPPRVLIGGWQGDGTLRFELRPDGGGMRPHVHPRLHRPRPGRADRGRLGPLLRPPRRRCWPARR